MMRARVPGEPIQIIAGPLLPAGGGIAATDGLHGRKAGFVPWSRFEHVAEVDTETGDSSVGIGAGLALGWLSGPAGMALGAVVGGMAGAFSSRTKLLIAQTHDSAFLLIRCRPAVARSILATWRLNLPPPPRPASLTERMRASLPSAPRLPSRSEVAALIPKQIRSRFDK